MSLSEPVKKLVAELNGETKLGAIKSRGKEIKQDHELALELWSEGSHNARLLATLIFDRKRLTETDIDRIAHDLLELDQDQRDQISDWLLANQLTKDKRLIGLLESWRDNQSPLLRRWFWYHQARLRWTGRTPLPENSTDLLDAMESTMADEDPQVQWTMNFCAGWIGVFDPELRSRCIKLGERLKLYKHEKVARNCTPSYLPEFIRIEVAKRT